VKQVLEKLIVLQPAMKFQKYYSIRSSIDTFTTAR